MDHTRMKRWSILSIITTPHQSYRQKSINTVNVKYFPNRNTYNIDAFFCTRTYQFKKSLKACQDFQKKTSNWAWRMEITLTSRNMFIFVISSLSFNFKRPFLLIIWIIWCPYYINFDGSQKWNKFVNLLP